MHVHQMKAFNDELVKLAETNCVIEDILGALFFNEMEKAASEEYVFEKLAAAGRIADKIDSVDSPEEVIEKMAQLEVAHQMGDISLMEKQAGIALLDFMQKEAIIGSIFKGLKAVGGALRGGGGALRQAGKQVVKGSPTMGKVTQGMGSGYRVGMRSAAKAGKGRMGQMYGGVRGALKKGRSTVRSAGGGNTWEGVKQMGREARAAAPSPRLLARRVSEGAKAGGRRALEGAAGTTSRLNTAVGALAVGAPLAMGAGYAMGRPGQQQQQQYRRRY